MRCSQCQRSELSAGMIVLTVVAGNGQHGAAVLCGRECLLDYVASLAVLTDEESPWTGDGS